MQVPATARKTVIIASWIVAAIAAAYVLIEHRIHTLEWLPFGLLLLCPLMHIFMHGSHHHGPRESPKSRA